MTISGLLLLENGCCLLLESGGTSGIILEILMVVRRATKLHLAGSRLNPFCGGA